MSTHHLDSEDVPVLNTLLNTLSHPIRRDVIAYFEQTSKDEEAGLTELVEHLRNQMASESDESLRIKLLHSHLPKLEDRGWLEYDPDTDRIRYHGHDSARQLLAAVHDIF